MFVDDPRLSLRSMISEPVEFLRAENNTRLQSERTFEQAVVDRLVELDKEIERFEAMRAGLETRMTKMIEREVRTVAR